MTPKEKAIELFKKYSIGKDEYGWFLCEFDSCAKRCAIIAVDEIINELLFFGETWLDTRIEFWQEVKQEIELL